MFLDSHSDNQSGPNLSVYDVYCHIVKAKKPNSIIPWDLPRKLKKLFPEFLDYPLQVIYNKITQSKVYPAQWTVENQILISKVYQKMTSGILQRLNFKAKLMNHL